MPDEATGKPKLMQPRQPQAISAVIKELFEQGINGEKLTDRAVRSLDIERLWENAVDKKAARHTRAVSLRRGCLVVNVENPAWAYELSLNKKTLLNKLNRGTKKYQISEIQFRLGKI